MIDMAKSSLDFRFGYVLKQQFSTGIPLAGGGHGFGYLRFVSQYIV
jgi:hypothetical protein